MSGKAIKSSRSLTKEELFGTYNFVKELLSGIPIEPIGSFGKKPNNDTYGDIDILVDISKVNYQKYIKIFEIFEYEIVKSPGFSQWSVGIPVKGDKKQGIAQVDFMFSTHPDWGRFIYGSPDYSKKESNFKSLYANLLLLAIISESFKKTEKEIDRKVLEYSMLSLRTNDALFKVLKTYEGKKGYLKTGKIIKEEFITDDVSEILKLAFGNNYPTKTFEKYWSKINSKDFIHKNKLDDIISKFKHYCNTSNILIPEEINKKHIDG